MPTTSDVPEFRAGQTELPARNLNKILGVTQAVGRNVNALPLVYRPRQILVETQEEIDAGKLGEVKIIGYDVDSNTFKEYSDAFEAFNLGPADAPAGARTPLTLGEGQIQFFNYFTTERQQSSSSSSSASSMTSAGSHSSASEISSSSFSSASSGIATENSIAVFDAAGDVKEADVTMLALQSIQIANTMHLLCAVAYGSNAFSSAAPAGSVWTRYLELNQAAGNTRLVRAYTAGSQRWGVGCDSGAETGGDAGSNWSMYAYTDAGAFIDTVFQIVRAAGGTFRLNRPFRSTSTIRADGGFSDGANAGIDGAIRGGETIGGGIITAAGVAFTSAFHVRQTSSQALSTSSLINWSSAEYDRNSDFDLANEKFVAPVDGIYHFYAQVTIDVGVNPGTVLIQLHKNGSILREHQIVAAANTTVSVSVATDITLAATDEVTIRFGSPTVADTTSGNADDTFFGGSGPIP